MATTSIKDINAIAIARGTSEPTNRDVLWLDDSITGTIYERLKYYDLDSGSWELVQRNAIQILEDLRTVDGTGSGLDADTLDGFTAAELMAGGSGGGSVPALSVGQLLVGQGDTIGTAQTVGGIATIDAGGALTYNPNTISHTQLNDIGTNTHTQIDTHIANVANPHGVTAGQVGNTTAQWNADRIEGNITNIGALGVGEDGQVLTWDNGTSRFIMAAAGGASVYTADDTITDVNRVVNLNAANGSSLEFRGGINSRVLMTNGVDLKFWDGLETVSTSLLEIYNSGLTQIMDFINGSASVEGSPYTVKLVGNKGSVNESTINVTSNIDITTASNLDLRYATGRGFRLGSTSAVNSTTEKLSVHGLTAIKGADTLSTTSAFEIYDNDTTPVKIFDVRNSGKVVVNGDGTRSSGFDINYDGASNTIFSVSASNNLVHSFYYGYEYWNDAGTSKLLQYEATSNYYYANFSEITLGGVRADSLAGVSNTIIGTTATKGTDTSSATLGFKHVDSAGASKFEVRNNGDLYTNGTQGLSNTYTIGGGGSGDLASVTFTNGILTAVTTVP